MRKETKLYGCGCKGGNVQPTPAPATTTTDTTTTTTVPTVQPTNK